MSLTIKRAEELRVGDSIELKRGSYRFSKLTRIEPNFRDALKLTTEAGQTSELKTTLIRFFPKEDCGCGRCAKCVASQARVEAQDCD